LAYLRCQPFDLGEHLGAPAILPSLASSRLTGAGTIVICLRTGQTYDEATAFPVP
jgi:hypothetical protein